MILNKAWEENRSLLNKTKMQKLWNFELRYSQSVFCMEAQNDPYVLSFFRKGYTIMTQHYEKVTAFEINRNDVFKT